jgi:hypothetical protein
MIRTPLAAAVMSKGAAAGSGKTESPDGDYDSAFGDAFADFSTAMKAGNSGLARKAFKAAVEMCYLNDSDAGDAEGE